MNYFEINSRALNSLVSVNKHVHSIDKKLKALVELRVSQINGCAYCIDLHSNEARKSGNYNKGSIVWWFGRNAYCFQSVRWQRCLGLKA